MKKRIPNPRGRTSGVYQAVGREADHTRIWLTPAGEDALERWQRENCLWEDGRGPGGNAGAAEMNGGAL